MKERHLIGVFACLRASKHPRKPKISQLHPTCKESQRPYLHADESGHACAGVS